MFKVYIKRYKTEGKKERFSFYSEVTGKIITVGANFIPNVFFYTGDSFYVLDREAMEAIVEAQFREQRFYQHQRNYYNFKNLRLLRVGYFKNKKR